MTADRSGFRTGIPTQVVSALHMAAYEHLQNSGIKCPPDIGFVLANSLERFWNNDGMRTEWHNVKEILPANKTGEQVRVLFCCPGWGVSVCGLFTCNHEDGHEWAEYDPGNDRYYVWKSISPTLWLPWIQPP